MQEQRFLSLARQQRLLRGHRPDGPGYRTGAVALPLDNYHNDGGTTLAPEIIHLDDALNLVELARRPGGVDQARREATDILAKRLADRFELLGPRLLETSINGRD